MSIAELLYEITLLDREDGIAELRLLKQNIKPTEFKLAIKQLYPDQRELILDWNLSEINRRALTEWDGFKIGDKVTARSTIAKAMILGTPKVIELATYPSLIGIELTIVEFLSPFIHCLRPSGSDAPGLLSTDIIKI
jgi:hypothetical protein